MKARTVHEWKTIILSMKNPRACMKALNQAFYRRNKDRRGLYKTDYLNMHFAIKALQGRQF